MVVLIDCNVLEGSNHIPIIIFHENNTESPKPRNYDKRNINAKNWTSLCDKLNHYNGNIHDTYDINSQHSQAAITGRAEKNNRKYTIQNK